MSLDSMKEIFEHMEQEGKPFWEIVLEADMDDRQVSRNQSMAKMLLTWQAMADAADNYTGRRRSVSGLVGGDGMKMRQYCFRGEAMSGGYVSEVIAEALSMAESNACMCRIVAAPTAGACGGLGNAADAVDHSAGTHHSSNSGRNRSNDLAGDAAIVSLSSGGSGLGSRCRGSFGSRCGRGLRLRISRFFVFQVEELALQGNDEAQGNQHGKNQGNTGQHHGAVAGFQGKQSEVGHGISSFLDEA